MDACSSNKSLSNNKNDIRAYGVQNARTKVDKSSQLLSRIESLRNSKVDGLLPDLSDKITASYLFDVLEDNKPIKLPEKSLKNKNSMQKQGKQNICFSGADVISLFPSLKGVEIARLARHAILDSKVQFENFDYLMALRYLTIFGGRDMLSKAGLGRLTPVWKGDRGDLVSIGGKK